MAISFLERGSSRPRALVKLLLDAGTSQFLSGDHSTLEHAPIIQRIGDIGQELDIMTRQVTYGSTDVTFLDDDTIRDLVDNVTIFGKEMQIFLGTFDEPEGNFVKIFSGPISKVRPFAAGVVISADDSRSVLLDRDLIARDFVDSLSDYIINRHPLQIILAILEKVFPAAGIDTASFDPDTYATGTRAISHWNTARAVHGIFDRRISEPASAMTMVNELAMLMDGTVLIGNDGRFKFKLFDPAASVNLDLGVEDYENFEQPETFSNLRNVIKFHFGWRGRETSDNEVLVSVPSGSRKAPTPHEYIHRWEKKDNTSAAKFRLAGIAIDREEGQPFESKWVGVNALLDIAISPTDTVIDIIGGWTGSFSGVDRILNGVSDGSVNSGLNSGDRVGYLILEFPEANLDVVGLSIPVKREVIKVEAATITFLNEGHPISNSDSDLVGVPMRVSFTVAGGVAGRGQFGTTALLFPRHSLVTDATIAQAFTLNKAKRLTNGLPIAEIDVGIEHVDQEIANFLTIENDVFLAEGENGLSGIEKQEIVGKTITPIGDDARVHLKFTPVEDPSLFDTDDIVFKPKPFDDDPIQGPQGNDDASHWGRNTISGGMEVDFPGGAVIQPRRGRVLGTVGPTEIPPTPPTIPLLATRDHFFFFDSHTRMFIRIDTAVGAAIPSFSTDMAPLWRVTSDGAGIPTGSPEDIRVTGQSIISDDMVGGSNRLALNGALSVRLRNSDRYPPEHLEVFPVTTIWGPPGAAGNDVELDTSAGSVITGDAAIKVISANRGVRSNLIPIDENRAWLGEFSWTGTAISGGAEGKVIFYGQDRRTVTGITSVFSKLPGTPLTFEFQRSIIAPPSGTRFAQLRFNKDPGAGVGSFAVLDQWNFKVVEDSFHAIRTTAQTLPSGVFTKILYNIMDTLGPFGTHNFGTRFQPRNPPIFPPDAPFFLAREDAEYEFEAAVKFDNAATAFSVDLSIFVNGTERKQSHQVEGPDAVSVDVGSTFATRIQLAAGDKADMRLFQDSGSTLDLRFGSVVSYFSGRQVT